jgi:hypothetical protein
VKKGMSKEELEQSVARLTLQDKSWVEQERKKKEIQEIENCSFKPHITQKAKALKKDSSTAALD